MKATIPASRTRDSHSSKPNANSSSGIAGIRAFCVVGHHGKPELHFSAFWRSGPKNKRKNSVAQRSAVTYGILGALKQVLDARAAGTRLEMPSPRQAWEIIKRHQGINAKGQLQNTRRAK